MGRGKKKEDVVAAPEPWGRAAGVLFAAALALRLLHLFLYRGDFWLKTPLLDDNLFAAWADVILKEGWLAKSLGVFDLNPAYPYLLAVARRFVGAGHAGMFALQHAVGALVPVLLFRLSDRAFGRRAAWCAGVLAALYGPAFFYESRFLGEAWIYFFNAAALFCLAEAAFSARRALWFAAAGLALGSSTVFRPNVLPFAAVALAWIFWLRREDKKSAVFSSAAFLFALWLPLLPFQLRNRAVDPAAGWGLTTSSGGVNLYLGNNPEADGLNKAPSFIRYGPGHEYQDFAEEAERRLGKKLSRAEVSRYWSGEVVRWYVRSPSRALKLLTMKAALFWNHDEPPDNFFPTIFRRFTALGSVPLAAWGLIAPLGLAGLLWSLRRPEARWFLPLHGYVGFYFAVNAAFYILSRYRFPAAAGLIPFAGYALATLFEKRALLPLGLLLLACLGLSRLPLIGGEDMAISHYSMGVIYAGQGWKDEAAAEYRKSIAVDPSFKSSHLNLGILEAQRGNKAQAVEALKGALALETDPSQRKALEFNIERLSRP